MFVAILFSETDGHDAVIAASLDRLYKNLGKLLQSNMSERLVAAGMNRGVEKFEEVYHSITGNWVTILERKLD